MGVFGRGLVGLGVFGVGLFGGVGAAPVPITPDPRRILLVAADLRQLDVPAVTRATAVLGVVVGGVPVVCEGQQVSCGTRADAGAQVIAVPAESRILTVDAPA